MRIIAGKYRSRRLFSPPLNEEVRPTTDRSRETLFNILNNYVSFENLVCADLFCGSGSFGLECISRGAEKCTFVDLNTNTLKKNTEALGVIYESEIIKGDALMFLKNTIQRFDIAFADPPFSYELYNELLAAASLKTDTFILEHSSSYGKELEFNDKVFIDRRVGASTFKFYNFEDE